jgi:hypothetical protein
MKTRKNAAVIKKFPEIKHLIQSIQRIEGNPDCFGKVDGDCDNLDCVWRELCLKGAQKKSVKDSGR